MPIEMPRGLPFSVDTWTPQSNSKRHHFLTHAHKDHCSGISSHFSSPIYCTHLTKSIILIYFPQVDESLFVEIEVGQCLSIDDPDGSFNVTAFDANHCPGAVMFLFEGSFGNILHTGDCRLTPECLLNLPAKYVGRTGKKPSCPLDFVFLDCTFGKSLMDIPSKQSALQQVTNCIWKHPDVPIVYLTCNLLGQEEVLVKVCQTFGSKIYVDKAQHPKFYKVLELVSPQIISEDFSSRFHLFEGFPKLYVKAKKKISEARENMQPEPLIIRPSAQWYAREETELTVTEIKNLEKSNIPVKDQFGVWHVCYSMHSSRRELEWALELLSPKWVISTTPECRAMELEYVKKYCISGARASDDGFWKVLGFTMEASSEAAVLVESNSTFEGLEDLQVLKTVTNQESLLALSPPKKKPPLTLFGRARLGYQSCISAEETKTKFVETEELEVHKLPLHNRDNKVEGANGDNSEVKLVSFDNKEDTFQQSNETNIEVEQLCFDGKENQSEKSNENHIEVADAAVTSNIIQRDTTVCKSVSYSYIGLSTGFSDNLRKFYRSMNIPVPRPLPSLVELMKSRKRGKRNPEI